MAVIKAHVHDIVTGIGATLVVKPLLRRAVQLEMEQQSAEEEGDDEQAAPVLPAAPLLPQAQVKAAPRHRRPVRAPQPDQASGEGAPGHPAGPSGPLWPALARLPGARRSGIGQADGAGPSGPGQVDRGDTPQGRRVAPSQTVCYGCLSLGPRLNRTFCVSVSWLTW